MEFEEVKYIDVCKEENLKTNFFCKWKVNPISTREKEEGDSTPPVTLLLITFYLLVLFLWNFLTFPNVY